jgi:type II secretory pathway pseudopilin PulG
MIEMMLAVAIVGTAMLAVVAAFSTAARTAEFVEESTTGEWVATSQIELIKTAAYVLTPGTYAAVPAPAGFAVANTTANVAGGDANIQIVTVIVTQGGENVYETSALKVNR